MKRTHGNVEDYDGWKDLPYEIVIHSIIGSDVIVFGKLLCVDKQLREWLDAPNPNSVLYANLLKYNFPSTYCLLHQLSYADEIQILDQVAQRDAYRKRIHTLFGYMSKDDASIKGRRITTDSTFKMLDDVYHTSFDELLSSVSIENQFIRYTPMFSLEEEEEEEATIERCYSKNDAKKISRFYAAFYPFGYPGGSYYLKSHQVRRSLVIEILRRSLKYGKVWYDECALFISPCNGNSGLMSPLDAFLYTFVVITRANVYAIKRAYREFGDGPDDTDYKIDWSPQFICNFDLDRCMDFEDITTEKILDCFHRYLAPFMDGDDKILTVTATWEEDDIFVYESIDQFSFATRLTNITDSFYSKPPGYTDSHLVYMLDAFDALKKAFIQAEHSNRVIGRFFAYQEKIDTSSIIVLCKETISFIDQGNIERTLNYNTCGDTYFIFRSFLYMALNKV